MMKRFTLPLSAVLFPILMCGQGVKISETSGSPHPSAILEAESTTQGLLPPRLTSAERDAIVNPSPGLRIYNTDTHCENFYNGGINVWMEICGTCTLPAPAQPSVISGNINLCAGESGLAYNVNEVSGVSFTWSFPSSWVQTGGGNTHAVTATAGNISGDISVTPVNACGNAGTPRILSVNVVDVPSSPTADSHISSLSEIEWNWNMVSGADGYAWNTSNDFLTATDVGTATTYTQTGLSPSTSYTLYVWAYNACGESLMPVTLNASTTCEVGAVGPGGGYIFYCGNAYPGKSGMEAAASDQSAGTSWGCQGTTLSGADGTAIGAGLANTTDIINGCATAGIAARLCADLTTDGGGWILPSADELTEMYTELHTQSLGGFTASDYWSSSEINGVSGAPSIVQHQTVRNTSSGSSASISATFTTPATAGNTLVLFMGRFSGNFVVGNNIAISPSGFEPNALNMGLNPRGGVAWMTASGGETTITVSASGGSWTSGDIPNSITIYELTPSSYVTSSLWNSRNDNNPSNIPVTLAANQIALLRSWQLADSGGAPSLSGSGVNPLGTDGGQSVHGYRTSTGTSDVTSTGGGGFHKDAGVLFQSTSDAAKSVDFSSGNINSNDKSTSLRTRCVRAF